MTLTDLSSDGKAKPNSLERPSPLHTEWSTANRAALLLVPCLSQSSLALSRGWFGWTFLFLLTKWQEIFRYLCLPLFMFILICQCLLEPPVSPLAGNKERLKYYGFDSISAVILIQSQRVFFCCCLFYYIEAFPDIISRFVTVQDCSCVCESLLAFWFDFLFPSCILEEGKWLATFVEAKLTQSAFLSFFLFCNPKVGKIQWKDWKFQLLLDRIERKRQLLNFIGICYDSERG